MEKWSYSFNGTDFLGEFSSKDEAIAEAKKKSSDYEELWVGKNVYVNIENYIDVDCIIEMINENLLENELSFCEDDDIISIENEDKFKKEIVAVFKKYCSIPYYTVPDPQKVP